MSLSPVLGHSPSILGTKQVEIYFLSQIYIFVLNMNLNV